MVYAAARVQRPMLVVLVLESVLRRPEEGTKMDHGVGVIEYIRDVQWERRARRRAEW